MSIAHWIGARAADVVAFFRDKPFVPCQVDWDEPIVTFWIGDPSNEFEVRFAEECCGIDKDCDCMATDTIAEFREWNQRR